MINFIKGSRFALPCLVLVTMLLGNSAEAISLRFKSKIFSSGPDIYACNAGVASAFLQNSICYFGGKKENGFCTPSSCSNAKENCNTDCVCLDKGAQGDSYINKLVLKSNIYDSNSSSQTHTKVAAGPAFQSVFTGTDAWNRKVYDLATYFMTEAYTGSYFVDICYRGSEIPDGGGYFVISTEAAAIPFLVSDLSGYNALDNNRAGLDFNDANLLGKLYTDRAELSVERFVVCGDTKAASDFVINPTTGVPTGGAAGNRFYSSSAEMQLRSSAQSKSHGSVIDPKFCKFRYVFRETNWKSATPNKRSNKGEGAEVCTYTKISDPSNQ
jgi:hypothetical protein